MTTRTAPLFRWRRICSDRRDAAHELFLLVLPFSFAWSSERPGPMAALAAILLVLVFAAMLWAQGWGSARAAAERTFAALWVTTVLVSLAVLTATLLERGAGPFALLPGVLAVAGVAGLVIASHARRDRPSLAARSGAMRRPLAPAVGVLAIMALAGGILDALGSRPLHIADAFALALGFAAFLALRRRGRSELRQAGR